MTPAASFTVLAVPRAKSLTLALIENLTSQRAAYSFPPPIPRCERPPQNDLRRLTSAVLILTSWDGCPKAG